MGDVIDLKEYGEGFRADPHPVYAELRALGPVHRVRLLHVLLHVGDRVELVGRLDIGEGVLQLALPLGVGPEGVALAELALGVQVEQVVG